MPHEFHEDFQGRAVINTPIFSVGRYYWAKLIFSANYKQKIDEILVVFLKKIRSVKLI
jgi:hypothetical protein